MRAYYLHNFLIIHIPLYHNFAWMHRNAKNRYLRICIFEISFVIIMNLLRPPFPKSKYERTKNFHSFVHIQRFFPRLSIRNFHALCNALITIYSFSVCKTFFFPTEKISTTILYCNQKRDYRCNHFLVIFNSIIIPFTLRKWEYARQPLFS